MIQVPTGQPVPDLWVKQTTAPPTSTTVVEAPVIPDYVGAGTVSSGETYQNPGNGAYVNVPAGNPVPDLWIKVPEEEIPPDAPVIQGQDMAGVANQAMQQAQITKIVTTIITGVGIGACAWLAYNIVTNPEKAVEVVKRYSILKDLLVDSSQIAVALLVICSIGFGSYEFFSFYEANGGDLAATVGDMLSSAFAITLEAVADGIVDLVKKLAEAIWDAIF